MSRVRVAALVVIVGALLVWIAAVASVVHGHGEVALRRDASGLLVFEGELPQVPSACVPNVSPVVSLAEAYRAEFGVPRVDTVSCRVTLPSSARGLELLDLAAQGRLSPPDVGSGKAVRLPAVDRAVVDVVGLGVSLERAWAAAERVSQEIVHLATTPSAFLVRLDAVQGAVVVVAGPEVLTMLDTIAPAAKGVAVVIEVRSDMAPAGLG